MHYSNIPIVITFILYGIAIYCIAIWSVRKTKNVSDYLLAGRSLSGPVTALGAGASDMSSWLLMALPGAVYLTGISYIWLPVALSIGAYLNWTFIARRLRVYTEIANDSLTLPEFLDNRFNTNKISNTLILNNGNLNKNLNINQNSDSVLNTDKNNNKQHQTKNTLMRTVTGLAVVIFSIMYSVSGFISGGKLLELIFAIEYQTALYISAGIIIVYTAIGGFLAINRVDFFQGILMFFALMVVPIITFMHLGGVEKAFTAIGNIDVNFLNLTTNVKFLGILSLGAWGLGYFGQPQILARFMAIRSIKELPIAKRICMSWMILSLAGAVITGLIGIKFYFNNPLQDAETVFMSLARDLFNPWVTGILLSAIISAVMSTVSALILMSGSAFVEDLYRTFIRKNKSAKEYLWASRFSVALIALIAVYIASDPDLTVLSSVAYAWSGLGGSFGPVILFSLYWKKTTKEGAVCGIAIGALTVILWEVLAKHYGGFFNHPDLQPGFSLLPAYILSSITIIIISLKTRHKTDYRDIDADFEKMHSLIAEAKT